MFKPAEEQKEGGDPEQRKCDDHKASDRTTAQRQLERSVQTTACCGRGTDVCANGTVHPGEPSEPRTDGADEEAYDSLGCIRRRTRREVIACKNNYGEYYGDEPDCLVLTF